MNKACKTYYKNLKLFLPIHKAKEKQLFQDIKSALTNLSEENPAINYSEICDELGNPEEIVADYYSNCDSSYLTKNLRFACYIRRMFVAVLIAVIIVTGVRSFYLHELYVQSQKAIPTHVIESIE